MTQILRNCIEQKPVLESDSNEAVSCFIESECDEHTEGVDDGSNVSGSWHKIWHCYMKWVSELAS